MVEQLRGSSGSNSVLQGKQLVKGLCEYGPMEWPNSNLDLRGGTLIRNKHRHHYPLLISNVMSDRGVVCLNQSFKRRELGLRN